MKLLYAPTSPYVRKVLAVAHEHGLADAIETIFVPANPIERDVTATAQNPLGKIPTLLIEDGTVLFDSRVICEYLDDRGHGTKLFPPVGPARWSALTEQALADGLLDAALLTRYETVLRPPDCLWPAWRDAQLGKIGEALDRIESAASDFGERVEIGTVATGCALGYLDFRFPELRWRDTRPVAAEWFERFRHRRSMVATEPRAS